MWALSRKGLSLDYRQKPKVRFSPVMTFWRLADWLLLSTNQRRASGTCQSARRVYVVGVWGELWVNASVWWAISWLTDGVLNDWWGGWFGWVRRRPWADRLNPPPPPPQFTGRISKWPSLSFSLSALMSFYLLPHVIFPSSSLPLCLFSPIPSCFCLFFYHLSPLTPCHFLLSLHYIFLLSLFFVTLISFFLKYISSTYLSCLSLSSYFINSSLWLSVFRDTHCGYHIAAKNIFLLTKWKSATVRVNPFQCTIIIHAI